MNKCIEKKSKRTKKEVSETIKRYLILVLMVIIVISIYINNNISGNNKLAEGEMSSNSELVNAKIVDGLELSNSKIEVKDGILTISADVKNTTQEEKGGYIVELTLIDNEDNEIETVSGYMNVIKAGETGKFQVNSTIQVNNIKNYTIDR